MYAQRLGQPGDERHGAVDRRRRRARERDLRLLEKRPQCGDEPAPVRPEEQARSAPHDQHHPAHRYRERREQQLQGRSAQGTESDRRSAGEQPGGRGERERRRVRVPEAPPRQPGQPEAEIGHQEEVHGQRADDACRDAVDAPRLADQRPRQHAQRVHQLPPGAVIHGGGGAGGDVADPVARAEEHAERQDLKRRHDGGPAGSEHREDQLRRHDEEDQARRKHDEPHQRDAAPVGLRQSARVGLDARHRREQHPIHRVAQEMRRSGHQLVGPPVESERRRTEPPPHDQVVDLEREIVRDLGGGEPAPVVHELPEGGAIREQAQRRRPGYDQDDGIEGRLGHLRRDQRPHPGAKQRQHDADYSVAQDERQHFHRRQPAEPQLALHLRLGDGREAVEGEDPREHPQHRLHARDVEEPRRERSRHPEEHAEQQAEQHRGGERGLEVTAFEHRSLDDGRGEAELREDGREADHDQRRPDDAEVGGREQPRHDREHQEAQTGVHDLTPADPHQPAQRLPGEIAMGRRRRRHVPTRSSLRAIGQWHAPLPLSVKLSPAIGMNCQL